MVALKLVHVCFSLIVFSWVFSSLLLCFLFLFVVLVHLIVYLDVLVVFPSLDVVDTPPLQ